MEREIQLPEGEKVVHKGQRCTFNVKVERGRPQARNVIPGEMTNFDSRNVVPTGVAAVAYQHPTATAYQQPVATAYQQPAATAYQQPAATAYQQPAATAYQQPVATAYQQPVATAYQQPAATAYQQPAATAYQQPVAMAYQQPTGGTPAAPSAQNGAAGLPAGWSSALDPSSGRPYYIDPEGKSHWTPPATAASPTGSPASPTAATAAAYQSSAVCQQYGAQQWGGVQMPAQWMQTPQYGMAGAGSPTAATAAAALDAPMQSWEISGTVKSFSAVNSYGFIVPDNGAEDFFVHQREIAPGNPDGPTLRRGQRVFFTPGQHNGRPQAKSVRSAPDQNPAPEAAHQQATTTGGAADAMQQWRAAMQYNDAAQTAGETVPDAGNALKDWQAAAGRAAATGVLQGVAMVAAKAIAAGDFSISEQRGQVDGAEHHQAFAAPTSDLQGPPPSGLQGPPPTGLQGPPPSGLQGPPPTGLQGPPPTGLQGPPPTGLQGPPPSGLQGPPPEALQGPAPSAVGP